MALVAELRFQSSHELQQLRVTVLVGDKITDKPLGGISSWLPARGLSFILSSVGCGTSILACEDHPVGVALLSL